MKVRLVPKRLQSPDGDRAKVYAYEKALDWLSLDPSSAYRGMEGAMKMGEDIFNDYNDDGKFEISKTRNDRGVEMTVNYTPPVSNRVEIKPDSVILYQTTQLPGNTGSVETRTAVPTQ